MTMEIHSLGTAEPFRTADGSTIRSLLDRSNAPVANQSLAEATIAVGTATQRHYHRESEEFYFLLEGEGHIEIDGVSRTVSPGDAILIPPGSWHQITADSGLEIRMLVCCAPPYRNEDTFFG
ncbi:MAG: cupin domain-containing protein [Thermoleophilia bacterium]|nr:cupin domain-containing protein [Thermoleophilia bacterium]MDH3724551.1 cupin domain-containing protein [Thermoleophilia bacterium]